MAFSEEEGNLLYVAVTRAKISLDISQCTAALLALGGRKLLRSLLFWKIFYTEKTHLLSVFSSLTNDEQIFFINLPRYRISVESNAQLIQVVK
ncbi:hypothetical protein F1978_17415 [Vreelandella piezotolerans]|uniref:DNA helicase n=1 Tax=Vreelandella piezotolerans TaxID=2609667 RepID=A0ABQ6X647_9GAMM|nr:hypothetical protein F1978_17415 [Halomonas piezotolerans]